MVIKDTLGGNRVKLFLSFLIGVLFVVFTLKSALATQQYSKIYLNPFYRSSMNSNTNYTYSINVNPPDGIGKVVNAMVFFSVYITPTVNYDLWVNNKQCNTQRFTISTTYAGAGLASLSFDCSNVIKTAGTYSIKLRADKNSGASYTWLDLTYEPEPKGKIELFGTEYTNNQQVKIWLQLVNSTGQAIEDGVCYVDVYTPDNEEYLERSQMTNMFHDGIYYYDMPAPLVSGVYPAIAICYYEAEVYQYFPNAYFQTRGTAPDTTFSKLLTIDGDDWKFKENAPSPRRLDAGFNITTVPTSCLNIQEELLDSITVSMTAEFDSVLNDDITLYIYNHTSNKWIKLTNKLLEGKTINTASNTLVIDNITSSGIYKTGKGIRIKMNDTTLTDGADTELKIDQLYFGCNVLANPRWQELRGASEIHISSANDYDFDVSTLCGESHQETECSILKYDEQIINESQGYIFDNVTVINNYQQEIEDTYYYETELGVDCTAVLSITKHINGSEIDITDNVSLSVGTKENCRIGIPITFTEDEYTYFFELYFDNYLKWEVNHDNDIMGSLQPTVTDYCYDLNVTYEIPIINRVYINGYDEEEAYCYNALDNLYWFDLNYNDSQVINISGEYESYLSESRYYKVELWRDYQWVLSKTSPEVIGIINVTDSLDYITNLLESMNINISVGIDRLIELGEDTNFTTYGINNYLQTTIYNNIMTNQQYLLNILSNQTQQNIDLSDIKYNLTSIRDDIDLLEYLTQQVNESSHNYWVNTTNEIKINRLRIDNVENLVNQTIIYLQNIQSNISNMQSDINNIQYNINNIQSNITLINDNVDNISIFLDVMNQSIDYNINIMLPYLSYIAAEVNNIELKLDCNYTINEVCDRLDNIIESEDDINYTVNQIYSLLLTFNGGCVWMPTYIDTSNCSIYDLIEQQKIYVEISYCNNVTGLPADNGTFVNSSCDYCSENIVTEKTVCEDGLQTYNFVDLNYDDCCSITGFVDDCSIDYYNSTNITFDCSTKVQCNFNSNPFLKSRIPFTDRDYIDFYCLVNLTGNYSCIAEVYKDGSLLQTNPDIDSVKMFGIVNTFNSNTPVIRGWYRKGTLLPDETFEVKMRCSEGPDIATSEFSINPGYKELGFAGDKLVWGKRNIVYLLAILAFVFVVVIVVRVVKA